jgi:hypothetical protein
MKTLLIIDAGLGQARAYMAKTLLGTAAQKAQLELIDNPNDAELAIVLGTALPADSALNGKRSISAILTAPWRTRSCSSVKPKAMQRLTAPRPLPLYPQRPTVRNASWRSPPVRPGGAHLYGGGSD